MRAPLECRCGGMQVRERSADPINSGCRGASRLPLSNHECDFGIIWETAPENLEAPDTCRHRCASHRLCSLTAVAGSPLGHLLGCTWQGRCGNEAKSAIRLRLCKPSGNAMTVTSLYHPVLQGVSKHVITPAIHAFPTPCYSARDTQLVRRARSQNQGLAATDLRALCPLSPATPRRRQALDVATRSRDTISRQQGPRLNCMPDRVIGTAMPLHQFRALSVRQQRSATMPA